MLDDGTTLTHVHGMVNLMRGLQPPTWAESPVTDEELTQLGLTRADYDKLRQAATG